MLIIIIIIVIGGVYGIYKLFFTAKDQNYPINQYVNLPVSFTLVIDQKNYKEYSFDNTTTENASRSALANIQSSSTALSYNSEEVSIFDPREIIKGEARNQYDDIYKFGSKEYSIKPIADWSRTFAVYDGENKLFERHMCAPNKAADDGISLLSVNEKLAVTFYECSGDDFFSNIYYDQIYINEAYNVTDATYLFSWNEQMGFVAKQQDKYYIFYNGQPVSPGFDKIHTKNCCAVHQILPTLFNNGVLVFYGSRDGQALIGEVKL